MLDFSILDGSEEPVWNCGEVHKLTKISTQNSFTMYILPLAEQVHNSSIKDITVYGSHVRRSTYCIIVGAEESVCVTALHKVVTSDSTITLPDDPTALVPTALPLVSSSQRLEGHS